MLNITIFKVANIELDYSHHSNKRYNYSVLSRRTLINIGFFYLLLSSDTERNSGDSQTKGIPRGSGATLTYPLPGQCIYCGNQFDTNEEKREHVKDVHKLS